VGVKVEKITILHQGPKQYKRLNYRKNKILEPSIKKMGEKPKPIKDHKEEPKSMNG